MVRNKMPRQLQKFPSTSLTTSSRPTIFWAKRFFWLENAPTVGWEKRRNYKKNEGVSGLSEYEAED
jgi:hypothetical protein